MPLDVPSTAKAATDFGQQFGFNALLVIVLLVGLGVMLWFFVKFIKDQGKECREEREKTADKHAAERAEDREAHLEKLDAVTGVLTEFKAALERDAESRRDAVTMVIARIERVDERVLTALSKSA